MGLYSSIASGRRANQKHRSQCRRAREMKKDKVRVFSAITRQIGWRRSLATTVCFCLWRVPRRCNNHPFHGGNRVAGWSEISGQCPGRSSGCQSHLFCDSDVDIRVMVGQDLPVSVALVSRTMHGGFAVVVHGIDVGS